MAPTEKGRYDGILNVDKPQGWTSHDVVAKIRNLTRQKQVGHAGTLDPMATGVLVVLLGQATRLSQFVSGHRKEYRAVIRLGVETDTHDSEGKILSTKEVPPFTREEIEEVLSRFTGEIEQVPPMYSAIKKKGVPLYRMARKGIEIEREPRKVTIYELELEEINLPVVTLRVTCSAGTYIRSLARDMGKELGCGAILSSLVRLASGPFKLADAIPMDKIENAASSGNLPDLILPMDVGVQELPMVIFSRTESEKLLHGQMIPASGGIQAPVARAYDEEGKFLALVSFDREKNAWRPKKVFAQ